MIQFLIRRMLVLIGTLFGITLLTFLLTRLTPGDPASLRASGSKGGSAASTGAYEDLVDLNRRNLGLDKPLFLNLEFRTPESEAQRVLDDLFRPSDFWRLDAEKRLGRIGVLAMEPALARFDQHERPGKTVEAIVDQDEARRRLVSAYTRLAVADTTATLEMTPVQAHVFWKAWWADNRARFTPEEVKRGIDSYLASAESDREATLLAVRRLGGYAVPELMRRLDAEESKAPLIAAALESITGYSFQDENPQQLVSRWQAWYRREQSFYTAPGGWASAASVVADTQFGIWMGQIIRFDFGESYVNRAPVSRMIREALPASLVLSVLSIIFSYLLAIPIGILSALKRHTATDSVITLILFVLYSLPTFWAAGILILTLTGPPFLTLFPTRGLGTSGLTLADDWSNLATWLADRAWHLVLPVLCLTYGSLAFISRQMRSAMLETITQDFIRTARAKGVSPAAVVWRHALRNSLIPIITISAGILPELIAGAVIIESIFSIPGMGNLTFTAILNRDYPVINAVLFLSAFLTLLGILIADLAYSVVDPRIDYR